ncbi:MAG: hypothetical protein ACRD40_12990 [Candidatus Acidiferrales bacterium]
MSNDVPTLRPRPVSAQPMLAVLNEFIGPAIPVAGPEEAAQIPRNWPEPTDVPVLPGDGLAQHPMLYAGEGYNEIFVVNHGKVIWTYSFGKGGEIDDVWMMSSGNILVARQFHVDEITPTKQIVWHYDAPPGTEVHTCQPIGLDEVLLVQNGLPPKMMIVDKATNAVEVEHYLPAESLTDPKTVHAQFRRFRMTAAGTYLAPFLRMNKVVEYDKNFSPIWTYEIPTPWDAIRLHNGNTLITDEHDKLVREVNLQKETVWEFGQSELPPNIVVHNLQTADRLANGDTVIFSSTGGTKPVDWPNAIQAVEVSRDKTAVWVLQDWKSLGPATTAQFLDQPGIPERPGDLQH